MLATENTVVERLNLAARGEVSRRGRTYVSDDQARDMSLAVGDRVRLATTTDTCSNQTAPG